MRLLKMQLAERLYQMKALLCQPGRSGQWRSWLRDRRIPRSTADRLASRHAETLTANTESVPTEASTGDPVEELVRSLLPRLRRSLTSPDAAFRFITAFAGAFDLDCEEEERGVLIVKRGQPANERIPPAADPVPETGNVPAAAVGAGAPEAMICADLTNEAAAVVAGEPTSDVV